MLAVVSVAVMVVLVVSVTDADVAVMEVNVLETVAVTDAVVAVAVVVVRVVVVRVLVTVEEVVGFVVVGGSTAGPLSQDHSTCVETLPSVEPPRSLITCSTLPLPLKPTVKGDSNEFASHSGAAIPLCTVTASSRKKW